MADCLPGGIERKKSRRRERILDAALELFLEHGVRAVSMENIAEEADIARRTIYNHFDGKDDVIAALAVPVMDRVMTDLDEMDACGIWTWPQVADLLFGWYETFGKKLQFIYSLEISGNPELDSRHSEMRRMLSAVITGADSESAPRFDDPAVTARLVCRTFVPLLSSLDGLSGRRKLFKDLLIDMVSGRPAC